MKLINFTNIDPKEIFNKFLDRRQTNVFLFINNKFISKSRKFFQKMNLLLVSMNSLMYVPVGMNILCSFYLGAFVKDLLSEMRQWLQLPDPKSPLIEDTGIEMPSNEIENRVDPKATIGSAEDGIFNAPDAPASASLQPSPDLDAEEITSEAVKLPESGLR